MTFLWYEFTWLAWHSGGENGVTLSCLSSNNGMCMFVPFLSHDRLYTVCSNGWMNFLYALNLNPFSRQVVSHRQRSSLSSLNGARCWSKGIWIRSPSASAISFGFSGGRPVQNGFVLMLSYLFQRLEDGG